jgi:hypothetical protein
MKRDMDLIRALLIGIADLPPQRGTIEEFEVEGRSDDEVQYHLRLMVDAGYLRVIDLGPIEGRLIPEELTWAGQEAAETLRNSRVWEATKQHVLTPLGSATFAFMLEVAKQKTKEVLGLPP